MGYLIAFLFLKKEMVVICCIVKLADRMGQKRPPSKRLFKNLVS